MYTIIKPKKFSVYATTKTNKLYAYQVRKITGADIVINGSLFGYEKWLPVCDVKINGKIISNDKYGYWGYGWNTNDSTMTMTNNLAQFQNYVSCVALVKDGKKLSIDTATDEVGRAAGRTGIGFLKDGRMLIWCTKEGTANLTIAQFQDKMYSLGCVTALNLDGGGSSQLSQDGSEFVSSTRKVQNYICIWIDKTTTNPYKEPTTDLAKGSNGEGVMWIQYQINKKTSFKLEIDGDFGSETDKAVRNFQYKYGLKEGPVDEATRKKLAE